MLGLFLTCYPWPVCLYDQALANVRLTGAGVKCYCPWFLDLKHFTLSVFNFKVIDKTSIDLDNNFQRDSQALMGLLIQYNTICEKVASDFRLGIGF